MNRRNLIFPFLGETPVYKTRKASGVSKAASAAPVAGPLDNAMAVHLLRRISFGPSAADAALITGKPVTEALDMILGDGLDYLDENSGRLPSGSSLGWLGKQEENPLALPPEIRSLIEQTHNTRYTQFVDWWIGLMREEHISSASVLSEKLTLFWHSHWCVEYSYDTEGLLPPPLLFRNLQKLRKYRLGNFKDMVEAITLDGAMLLYQSLNLSSKEAPNENYARELLELFTMGIGHYEEFHIREIARLLTGWRISAHLEDQKPLGPFETYFERDAHYLGNKNIFGTIIPARDPADNTMEKVRVEEVRKMIDIMFEKRGVEISEFICDKLYRFFIYSDPVETDKAFISSLATIFRDNDFEIRPVVKAMLASEHFYSETVRGVQIKQPVEYALKLQRLFGFAYEATQSASSQTEQTLYDPPNVSGWYGHRAWINTVTYPVRVEYLKDILNFLSVEGVIAFIQDSGCADTATYSSAVYAYVFPKALDAGRIQRYDGFLLQNGAINDGNFSGMVAEKNDALRQGMKSFLEKAILAPDFELA